MPQGRFRLHITRNIFSERVLKDWNKVPKKVVEFPSLEVSKRGRDVVLRDVV